MQSFYERLMESGCQEDYARSLTTEGDMTYADADWLEDDTEPDVEAMIDTLQRLGYAVTFDA